MLALFFVSFSYAQDDAIDEGLDYRDDEYVQNQTIDLLFPRNGLTIGSGFNVSPNPTSTSFDLSVFVRNDEPMFWLLIDRMGRGVKKGKEVLKEGQNVFNVAVHDLPRGIYVLQVKIRDEVLNKRLMIW